MLVCILILALLAPVALMPLILSAFTPAVLDEMGVCLESPESTLEQTDTRSQGTERRSLLNGYTPILCLVKK